MAALFSFAYALDFLIPEDPEIIARREWCEEYTKQDWLRVLENCWVVGKYYLICNLPEDIINLIHLLLESSGFARSVLCVNSDSNQQKTGSRGR